MKSETYPLALPPALLGEVRRTAKETGLSLADAMRQNLELGLPKLREQLATPSLKPFTPEEAREAFAPDPEWDAVTAAMFPAAHLDLLKNARVPTYINRAGLDQSAQGGCGEERLTT